MNEVVSFHLVEEAVNLIEFRVASLTKFWRLNTIIKE